MYNFIGNQCWYHGVVPSWWFVYTLLLYLSSNSSGFVLGQQAAVRERVRVKLEEGRCEILMSLSVSITSPFIIHPTLKVELPPSHAGSCPLMCLLFLGCWRLCWHLALLWLWSFARCHFLFL